MKKTIVAVMLVVTMLMSTVCCVGAAGLTSLDDLRALVRESLVVGDIQVATTSGEYANSISVTSSTQFKARATLDMTHVKRDIRRAYDALGSDELRAQLDEKYVYGQFIFTVNIGDGIYVLPETASAGDMAGFNEATKVLFEETAPRVVNDDAITVTIGIVEGTKVRDLAQIPEIISFEHTGLKTVATTQLGGTIDGSIEIQDLTTVDFKFIDADDPASDIKPAKITISSPGPDLGGGSGTTDDSTKTTVKVGGTSTSIVLDAKVKDDTVTINEILTDTLKPVIDKKVETGVVYVDASGVEGNINTVSIPAIAVDSVANATKEPGNDVTGLKVIISDKTIVEADAAALGILSEKVTNKPLVVKVSTPASSSLTSKQNTAAKNLGDNAELVEVKLSTNNSVINDFGEGAVKVTVPYELKDGERATNVAVWALDSEGNLIEVPARYDIETGTVTFEMNAENVYVIDIKPAVAHPVPEMLNGDSHFAYLSGYEDKTIRPESNITRAEVATIFFRLLKDEVRDKYMAYENNFVDVNKGDWFNTAISTMANAGVVNGRTEDTFAPNEYITRAEFTTICARFDDSNSTSVNKFTDVNEHWAEDYILESVAYGWIEGYEDYTFRPEAYITRAEAATLINRVLNRVPATVDDMLDDMVKWPDNSNTGAWYYIAIQEATNSHTSEKVNEINEKWVEVTANRDWTVFEK